MIAVFATKTTRKTLKNGISAETALCGTAKPGTKS